MNEHDVEVQETQQKEELPKRWKDLLRTIKRTAICVLITGIVICGITAALRIASLEASLEEALLGQAPVEITSVRIKDRLLQIGELATASYEYENLRTIIDVRQLFGWDIPGTENTVEISYCGVVKAGYDVANIEVEVDTDKQLILITLPEPEVKDNYIKLDGLLCSSTNNLLNPIQMEDLPLFFEDVTEEALEGAEDHGIFDAADERMKELVTEFLAVFPDYTVIFC